VSSSGCRNCSKRYVVGDDVLKSLSVDHLGQGKGTRSSSLSSSMGGDSSQNSYHLRFKRTDCRVEPILGGLGMDPRRTICKSGAGKKSHLFHAQNKVVAEVLQGKQKTLTWALRDRTNPDARVS
jgi:hypothetical protein